MWLVGGGDQQEATKGEEQPDSLKQIDQREKARLVQAIDSNKYVRRSGSWQFRNGLGLRDFLFRGILLIVLFLIAFFSNPKSPRGREDKEWLISFSMVMIIWFTAIHAIAYLPSMIFGGFKEMREALFGHVAHAYTNWRDYQYIAAILVLIVVLYPFMLFFYLIWDGFNPYDNLTTQEMRLEGGLTARICYIFRIILHLGMLVVTVYMAVTLLVVAFIRHRQSTLGQYYWIAQKISTLPYGSLFFQEGEYFDCANCLEGIWTGSEVVRLTCGGDDKHVFHVDCIRNQVAVENNLYCVICGQPIVVQNPPPAEPTQDV